MSMVDIGVPVVPCFGPAKFYGDRLPNQFQLLLIVRYVWRALEKRGEVSKVVRVPRRELSDLMKAVSLPGDLSMSANMILGPAAENVSQALHSSAQDTLTVDSFSVLALQMARDLSSGGRDE